MSAAGDPDPRAETLGELVPRPVTPSRGRAGSVFDDLVSRLRPYVAPPPPSELGWQAAAGTGMMLGAAGLLELLPAGSSITNAGLLKWVGRSGLASLMDSARPFAMPLCMFALAVLVAIALIYWRQFGAAPALVFLSVQTWLGVLVLASAGLVWVYALLLAVINLAVWVAFFIVVAMLCLAALAIGLRMLGALADA